MEIKFICEDSYEAEKLSSIFTSAKRQLIICDWDSQIIENEAVVKLKDGSHHSILFKDRNNALMLKKMFTEISLTKNKIISMHYRDNEIFMIWGNINIFLDKVSIEFIHYHLIYFFKIQRSRKRH